MALAENMTVDADGIEIRIIDPNPLHPRAVITYIGRHWEKVMSARQNREPLIQGSELSFSPLGSSGKEWIEDSGSGWVLRDWHGDGTDVELGHIHD